MYLYRTKFKGIVTEFAVPENLKSKKVLLILSGLPGYPHKLKYEKIVREFTLRGYYIFIPRYRGTWESEGKLFEKCPCFDVVDVIEGIQNEFKELWGGKTFKITSPQVFVYGVSFGGPAALFSSTIKEVKKVLALSPVVDWRTMDDTVEPIPVLSRFVSEAFGEGYRIVKGGWKKIEEGFFYNPATGLEKIDTKKVLIIHAEDDDVISLESVRDFVAGAKIKSIFVKKGGHGPEIFSPRFKQTVLKFLS